MMMICLGRLTAPLSLEDGANGVSLKTLALKNHKSTNHKKMFMTRACRTERRKPSLRGSISTLQPWSCDKCMLVTSYTRNSTTCWHSCTVKLTFDTRNWMKEKVRLEDPFSFLLFFIG